MEGITYIGLDKLDTNEIAVIQKISIKEFGKVKKSLDVAALLLRVRKFNKEGRKAVYEIKSRIDSPSIKFHAENSDWELQKALHKTFDNLKVEIERKHKKGKVKWPNRIIKE